MRLLVGVPRYFLNHSKIFVYFAFGFYENAKRNIKCLEHMLSILFLSVFRWTFGSWALHLGFCCPYPLITIFMSYTSCLTFQNCQSLISLAISTSLPNPSSTVLSVAEKYGCPSMLATIFKYGAKISGNNLY